MPLKVRVAAWMEPLLQSPSVSAPSDELPFVSESPAPTQDVLGDTGWSDWHLAMGLLPPPFSMYHLLIPTVPLLARLIKVLRSQ